MSKMLFVGDPHVKPDELQDCENLLNLVFKTVVEKEISTVVFLGDLFHTHAILHVSVLKFWEKWFSVLSKKCKVIAIKGNHDASISNPNEHALSLFSDRILVIDKPYVYQKILFMPYYGPSKEKEFFEDINKTLKLLDGFVGMVCHDTFQGAYYENGFYAPEGFDINKIDVEKIISGHIHTPQMVKNCVYVGSPRWQTVSDANIERFINIYDARLNLLEKVPTMGICKSIHLLNVRSLKDLDIELPPNSEVRYDVSGTEEMVNQISKEIEKRNKNAVIRTFFDKNKHVEIRESEGIYESYIQYSKKYAENKGLSDSFLDEVKKRARWANRT